VASTGWFVFQPAKRSFNYELLPSELVGNIEVYKSSQADLPEGGVGGTVMINTRNPLDLDDLTVFVSAEAQYQDDSEETDPLVSGLVSWKNESETFGALISAVSGERSLQRQGDEAFWEWGAGPVAFEQERKRTAFTGALQWRPNENFDAVLNYVDMEMEADNTNHALWLTQGNTSWSGVEVPDECLLQGTPVCGPLNVAFAQVRPREATMESDVIDLDMTWRGDGYTLEFQIGETTSSGGTDFEMVADDGTGGTPIQGGTYDFTRGKQTWDTGDFDIAAYDPGTLVMGQGSAFNATPKTDEEQYAQLDAEFDFAAGPIYAIKAGVRYADHNTSSRRFEFIQDPSFNPVISTAEVADGTIDVGASNMEIRKYDGDKLKRWAKSSIIGRTEDLGAYSEIDEENSALYALARFEGDTFRGNFGIRYVATDATSTYYLDGVKNEVDADYSEILPSFNLAMDINDELVARFSAARVMARPQYVDMYVNPDNTGTNDDLPNNQFWIVGNVGLDPYVANQFDVGLEWYFNDSSLLSFTVFTKDVKNFVTFSEYSASADEIPFELPDYEAAFGWTVQEKDNGKSAEINGFEVIYQQDFGNGWGVTGNYTYTDSDVDEGTFTDGNNLLSDSSQDVVNLSGYYENNLFQARLSYNWRSEYMIRDVGAYANRLHEDYGTLDFSSAWFVTDNITVNFDVINITEEEAEQTGNNNFFTSNSGFTEGFPVYSYETPRRFILGVSARF
jgi:iron complex outermembrane receptor protein